LLKVVACSGDENGPMVQKLRGSILGIKWDRETDKFSVPLTANVTERRRGETTGPDVTNMSIKDLDAVIITRRIALSITMSLYDPLGYICPITIRLKWLLQHLGDPGQIMEDKQIVEKGKSGGWDTPLTHDEKDPWIEILKLMVKQGSIVFNRSCKPTNMDLSKEDILINYMDGSNAAKAFVAYISYLLESGLAHVALLSAKSKLNPAGGQSTPSNLWFANRLGEVYDCMRDLTENIEVVW
jgi:hypothetical protein